jgi:hypothetical protein
MENQDSMLVRGFYPKQKHPSAPDFVLGKGSINLPQFAEFMREFKAANPGEDWVNIDMKLSRSGKGYASVDTWKPDPEKVAAPSAPAMAPVSDDDLPF